MLHVLVAPILIAALLSGCSAPKPISPLPPDQVDKSPFTGIPCAAPCWHGLTVGKSTESDVTTTLGTLTFIDQKTINSHRMPSMPSTDPSIWAQGAEITADCKYDERPCLTLRVVEDVLTEIVIELNYEIEVNAAIGYLGQPDYVGYRNLGAEQIRCEIDLVWSKKQLVLVSALFEGPDEVEKNCSKLRHTGKIAPNLQISNVRYLSAPAIEELRHTGAGEFFEFSGIAATK